MQVSGKKKMSRAGQLYLLGGLILLGGLLAAAVIYLSAGEAAGDGEVLGYEIVNGQAYAIAPNDSKIYQRDLERVGGKAALLAADLSNWFAGLWTGRQLAWTVAILALGLALACFWLGWLCAGSNEPDDAHEN